MREPARIKKLLSLLEKYWEKNPNLRLCQIIGNITRREFVCSHCRGKGWRGYGAMCIRCNGEGSILCDNYNVEDEEIIRRLEVQ